MDATINNNKLCKDVTKHLPINKNRKGIKVSFLINNRGIILSILIDESTVHDSKFAIEHIKEFLERKNIVKLIKKHKNKIYFLADSAYDNEEIKKVLEDNNIRFIIKPNNKNTKNPLKRRYLSRTQKRIYKNRIKIEHCFGTIKRYPKINCVYEKTLDSYRGILFLIAAVVNLRKI
jgi:transposase